jgi:hypothetical protein
MVNYLFEISQSIAKSNKKTVTKIQISSLLAELNGIDPQPPRRFPPHTSICGDLPAWAAVSQIVLMRLYKIAISALLSPRNLYGIRAQLALAWVFQNLPN